MAQLTPSQMAAVEHFQGPLLVLAGPGSGKTRVVTQRIARLIDRGVAPASILAITFTNKAAREMQERAASLVPGNQVPISTFHRFCARTLRRYGRAVGLESNFTIMDSGDQQQLLRQALIDEDIDPVTFTPARVAARISHAKNDSLTPEKFAALFEDRVGTHWDGVVARVYPRYQKLLQQANAVDFDDLLLHVARLIIENEELCRSVAGRYQYVLVDEYQDTNITQYQIVATLAREHRNLCVTGDPDQSIYGWRGAKIENILRFEQDYPEAKVIRLEENFRSTPEILAVADRVIACNSRRKIKQLITANPTGVPVEMRLYADAMDEADGIAREIKTRVERGERNYADYAVFYRVNSLSRQVEAALGRYGIPYQLAGGVAFFDRAEIKDLLGFLRIIENPADRAAFLRVINNPPRGIGRVTQRKLMDWAEQNGINFLEAAERCHECPGISKRATASLKRFSHAFGAITLADAGSIERLLDEVIDRSGYTFGLKGSADEQDLQRLANIEEFLGMARQYDESAGPDRSLTEFLESTSLMNDVDNVDPSAGQVTLMTLHSAKGLEFPSVYLIGVEQNILPHERALQAAAGGHDDLEEERRLLFVGLTRAQQELVLTQTRRRELRGRSVFTIPSDFFAELRLPLRDMAVPDDEPTSPPSTPYQDLLAQLRRNGAQAEQEGRPLLMTAAQMLESTPREADLPSGFSVGMQVRHPRYGLGTVISTGGHSRLRTVTVEFSADARTEKFVVSKCVLQPVGL